MKALKETSDGLKYGLTQAARTTWATAELAKINGELLVRFSVAGISAYLGRGMQLDAEALRNNTISQLTWNLRDAEIKADLAEHALMRAKHGRVENLAE